MKNTRDAIPPFSAATGSAIDPACGTGGFLAYALGIWFTPQHVLDFLEGKPTANPDAILGNPPFATESPNAKLCDASDAFAAAPGSAVRSTTYKQSENSCRFLLHKPLAHGKVCT